MVINQWIEKIRSQSSKNLQKRTKMGIIYMITSPTGKRYIGQHVSEDLEERKRTHLYRYSEFLKKKLVLELKKQFNPDGSYRRNPTGFCTALYCAFQKYGYENFKWQRLFKNLKPIWLNAFEDSQIRRFNTLAPNGYNLKVNNSHGSHCYSEESRKRMSESQKIACTKSLHKYRRKQGKLKKLPKHVTYFKSGGKRGYRVVNHPNCKSKEFTVPVDSQVTDEELYEKTFAFMKRLKTTEHKTQQQLKAEKGIPKGISEQRPGRFIVQFRRNGIRYTKFFSQSPRSEALRLATEWMETKKQEIIASS